METMFFVVAFVSEVIGTIAGFGSSTVFLPFALLFVDFKTALVLVAFLHIFGNLSRLSFFRRGLDLEMLVKFGLPSVVFTIFGAMLVPVISQSFLKGVLGVFLICYSLLAFWKNKVKLSSKLVFVMSGGSISGFLTGLIGTGGALRGIFLTGFGLPKERYIATAAAIALVVDITRIPVYMTQGFLDAKYYWYLPVLLITALGGSYIGKQIVVVIPQSRFEKLVLLAVLFVGVKFTYDWLRFG